MIYMILFIYITNVLPPEEHDIFKDATMADDNVEYRVGELESDVKDIKTDVKKILENHLPHINVSIAVLICQVTLIMGGLGWLLKLALSP